MPVVPSEIDCTPKCRSATHYLDLIRVASQSIPIQIILNYLCRCGNCAKGHDKYGRTLIQVCSALSDKWSIIDWLLKQKKVDINPKNLESGYTALHYSVFYGRIDNTINLIKAGANINLLDHDYMTYIDHVIRDTYIETPSELLDIESYEVFTMGENTNGNLGHSQSTAKKVPEVIDIFRRDSICIKKVKMDKYHTLFLSDNGSVYSCGIGVGGRLGHDNEESILIPKQIITMETIKETEQDRCIDISITRDCSYFLTEKGCLWSCGLNNYHQLGHPGVTKLLVPTKVQFRQIKDRKITHIACGRFHVALIVENSQLLTFGINAGQLGHPKGNDFLIPQPLTVTKFNSQSEHIEKLVSSDYAIVCYTNKDIYVLTDYKIRKIVKGLSLISQIVVVGGKLDSNGIPDEENLDEDLKVFYVHSKKLYLYHEREPTNNRSKLCLWTTKQRLTIEQIVAGTNAIIFTTNTGQVYTASLDKLSNVNKKIEHDSSSNSIYDERAYQYLTPSPIPLLHRCRSITTDRSGRLLAALQYHPTTHLNAYPRQPESIFYENLHELLSEAEHLHDITLEINTNQTFPAHKYILSMRSPYFRERISKKEIDHLIITNESNNNLLDPELFQLILEYMYSNKCPWLSFSEKIKTRNENEYQAYLIRMKSIEDDIDDHRYFTRMRQQAALMSNSNQQQQHGTKSKKKKKGPTSPTNDDNNIRQQNDEELNEGLERLIEFSKLFQLHNLRKRLETIKQSRLRNTNTSDESIGQIKHRYYYTREALPELHDVTIISEDGKKISCHKCILTSRLDYFRSMFLADWIESQSNSELKMAIPSDLLEIIIDYLYTDNISSKYSVEQLCQILVLSDQLLIERLKQICEFHIANLVTFRDATELLQFSATYNAQQLRVFVEQFICRNMATFLEARLLENLDNQLLNDLSKSYRRLLDCMNYRMITPYSDCPSLDEHSFDLDELENLSIDIDETTTLAMKKQQSQQKRKQQNKLRTSESENINKSSPPMVVENTPTVVRPKKHEEEKWTSVSSKKTSKASKNAQTPAVSNNAVVSPNRPMIPGAVYSQQEAEKLAAAKKAASQEMNTNRPVIKPVTPQPTSKPSVTPKEESVSKNPWKTTSVPTPIPLKSTFSTEKETNIPKPTAARPANISNSTRSIPIVQPSPPQHDVANPWSVLATSPPSTSPYAYSTMSIASSPPAPPMSFKHIQDQEARAHEALRQISNKSLEKIQTEELAIQALHRLYNSSQEFDMFITVERVVPEIANPIWPRTSSSATTAASSSSPSLLLITQKKGQK